MGGFLNGHFIPVGPPKRLDLGNVVYAPNTCVDGKQRQLLWGWVQEVRDSEACVAAGYAGCLTLPRVVAISDDGELLQVGTAFSLGNDHLRAIGSGFQCIAVVRWLID